MKTNRLFASLMLVFAAIAISCTSEDPVFEIDQELITDVTMIFTEVGANGNLTQNSFTVTATDPEGLELGTEPIIQEISQLEPGKRYRLDLSLYNSIDNEDVTEEILEDADDHQFYFLGTAFVGDGAFLTYEYADEDEDGNPLGLTGFVNVSAAPPANNGGFRLVLRHDLNKSHEGANHPNFENFVSAGGETDLDVTFPVILN